MTDTQPVSISLNTAEPLSLVLQKCSKLAGIELGGVIIVRDGKVMSRDEYVNVNDTIDVFPAISGG